jgi:hypothetical protein
MGTVDLLLDDFSSAVVKFLACACAMYYQIQKRNETYGFCMQEKRMSASVVFLLNVGMW